MLIRRLPATSSLGVVVHGPGAAWTAETHILAAIADATRSRVWQAGGGKGSRPKPIPRPDDKQPTTYGKNPIPLEEARARFAARDAA